jgi:hypothetical protein
VSGMGDATASPVRSVTEPKDERVKGAEGENRFDSLESKIFDTLSPQSTISDF